MPQGGRDRLLGLDPEIDGDFSPGEDHNKKLEQGPKVVCGHGQAVREGEEPEFEGAFDRKQGPAGCRVRL